MLRKEIIRTILYGIGLGSLAAVVYFAGPFIAFGEWRPLENPVVRNVVILLLVAGVAAVAGFGFYRRQKGAKQIAEGISGADETVNDEPVLKERMNDALATLKTASGNKSDYLYDLPWYVIIGPPGAGKTTALVNSGLKFPLARGSHARRRRGRRRHALLRLVVHRRSRADRHGRSLHDAGFRRQERQAKLALVPRSAEEEPAAPADQRRHGRHQPRRHADDVVAGIGRTCGRDPRAAARTASAAQGQLSGLCVVHQGRSDRGLQRIFRLSQ